MLPEEEVRALMEAGEAEVDLEALEVRFDGRAVPFELNAETRRRLLAGLDDIAIALEHDDEIAPTRPSASAPGRNADALITRVHLPAGTRTATPRGRGRSTCAARSATGRWGG